MNYHYTHIALWAVAAIPLLTSVILWIRIGREEDENRRLRRRLLEYVARYEGDVDDDTPLDEEIYNEAYRKAMENR